MNASQLARILLVIITLAISNPGKATTERERQDPFNTIPTIERTIPDIDYLQWDESCKGVVTWKHLTRMAAVSQAICANPKLKRSYAQLLVNSARLGQAVSSHFPTLNFSASENLRKTHDFLVDNRAELQVRGDNEHIKKSGLQLSLPIYNSGATEAGVNANKAALRAAQLDFQEQAQSLVVDTLVAYTELYFAHQLIDVLEQGQSIALQALKIAQMREAGGIGSRSERLQAQAGVARTKIDLARGQEDLLAKRIALSVLLAVPPEQLINPGFTAAEVQFNFDVNSLLASNVDQEILRNSRPSLGALQARLLSAEAQTERVKREGMAALYLTAGYSALTTNNRGVMTMQGPERTVGLNLNIPLFEGFGRTYKIKEALATVEGARQDVWAEIQRIDSELNRNQKSMEQALELTKYTSHYQATALEAHAASLLRYRKGLAEITEVLNAQRELAQADSERLRISVKLTTAYIKLARDLGRLQEVLQPAESILYEMEEKIPAGNTSNTTSNQP